MRTSAPSLLALLATAALIAACAPSGDPGAPSDGTTTIVTSVYPLRFVAERVGGDEIAVTGLAPPGADAHDLELTGQQVAELTSADLVLYLAGFQPAVDEAVTQHAGDRALDAGTVVPPRAGDPHLWLDPRRLATVADAVAGRLAELDPAGAAGYRSRAGDLRRDLTEVDTAYQAGLASCERREIVVGHAAFGYLAERYDLTQIAVTTSPEAEPSPQRIAEAVAAAAAHQATTIFKVAGEPGVASVIAREAGLPVASLNPIERPPSDRTGDYLTAMRDNLATLRGALGCA